MRRFWDGGKTWSRSVTCFPHRGTLLAKSPKIQLYFLSFDCPVSKQSYVYSTDKLGAVGTWIRHRLLVSILMGTPPLVAIQVKFSTAFQYQLCIMLKNISFLTGIWYISTSNRTLTFVQGVVQFICQSIVVYDSKICQWIINESYFSHSLFWRPGFPCMLWLSIVDGNDYKQKYFCCIYFS